MQAASNASLAHCNRTLISGRWPGIKYRYQRHANFAFVGIANRALGMTTSHNAPPHSICPTACPRN